MWYNFHTNTAAKFLSWDSKVNSDSLPAVRSRKGEESGSRDYDILKEARGLVIACRVCDPAAYQLLISLTQPAKQLEKFYNQLVKTLTGYCSPKPSSIFQRYKFHLRIHQSGESVATYIAELKACGQHCAFGDSLYNTIRDRIVCGISDNPVFYIYRE